MSKVAHLQFNASAGTGKTHQVVGLYRALLLGRPFPDTDDAIPGVARGGVFAGGEGIPPERILMLTFARNAAAEMRARIVAALEKELSEEQNAADAVYWSLLRRLAGATIATIHSYAQQLLAQNVLRQALSPSVRMADDSESSELLTTVIEQTLRSGLGTGAPDAAADLERICSGRGIGAVVEAVAGFLRTCRTWGVDLAAVDPVALVPQPVPPAGGDLARLAERVSTCASASKSGPAARFQQALHAALGSGGADMAPAAVSAVAAELRGLASGNWGKGTADLRRFVVEELDRLAGYAAQVRAVQLMAAFLRLARECLGAYEQAKRTQGLLDFDDLLIKALDLVQRYPDVIPELDVVIVDEAQDNSHIQNELLRRIAVQTGAALIVCGDRKQSIYAWRGADPGGVARLAREFPGLAAPLQTNYRSQQDLLTWLNELFATVLADTGLYGPEAQLKPCPRALTTMGPNVEILCLAAAAAAPCAEDEAVPEDAAEGPDRAERIATEARAVARRIKLLTAAGAGEWRPGCAWDGQGWRPAAGAGYRYREILILLRATSTQEVFEAALQEEGIPYTTDGRGKGFFCRPEVLDMAGLLQWLAMPCDDVALVAVLRSPLVALSDGAIGLLSLGAARSRKEARPALRQAFTVGSEESRSNTRRLQAAGLETDAAAYERACRVLAALAGLAGRVSAVDLLREAVRLTGYDAILAGGFHGAQRLANLRKLLSWIQHRERVETLDLQGVARRLRQMIDQEAEEPDAAVLDPLDDSVRINTVHAAKGLSSPIVFIPDLRRAPRADTGWVGLRQPGDAAATAAVGKMKIERDAGGDVDEVATPGFADFREERRAEREAESRRLFYVACTRPRDLLVLSGVDSETPRKGSWEAWVAPYRAQPRPGITRIREYAEVDAAWRAARGARAPEAAALTAEAFLRPVLEGTAGEAAQPFRLPATVVVKLLQDERVLAADARSRADLIRELLPGLAGLAPAWVTGRVAVSPDAVDEAGGGMAAPDENELQPGPEWGTLVHAVLEDVEYWSARPLAEQIARAPGLATLSPGAQRAAQAVLERAAGAVAGMLRDVPRARVFREAPFVARFARGAAAVLVDGKIDLLYFKDGEWSLVDYKVTDDSAERLRERYGFQLALYREAVLEPAQKGRQCAVRLAGAEGMAGSFALQILAVRSDGETELVQVEVDRYPDVAGRVVAAADFLRVITAG